MRCMFTWVQMATGGSKEVTFERILECLEYALNSKKVNTHTPTLKTIRCGFNPTALRKSKIVYNFGLSECSRVKTHLLACRSLYI